MAVDPFENAELERAERAVAHAPSRTLLPPRGRGGERPASRVGRVLTVVAPLAAIATVGVEMLFSFASTSVESVWVAVVALVAVTIAVSIAAGEYGGRWGRISGVASGIVIIPPIGMAIAWWSSELIAWLARLVG